VFNSTTLEVAIGMALIFLLVSLFCTAINEAIAGFFNTRAKNLEKGIKSLFTQGNLTNALSLTDAIYRHGLVQGLYRSGAGTGQQLSDKLRHPPSYIPSRTFASALYDTLFGDLTNPPTAVAGAIPPVGGVQSNQLASMLAAIQKLPDSPAKQAIATLVKEASGDVERLRLSFERWYDDGMDRAAGWYKKKTQWSLFLIGLIAAGVLNVDTVVVARSLWTNPAMRTFAATYADTVAKDPDLKAKLEVERARAEADRKTAAVSKAGNVAQPANQASHSGSQTSSSPSEAQSVSNATAAAGNRSATLTDLSKDLKDLKSRNLPIGYSAETAAWPYYGVKDERFWQGGLLSLLGWILTAFAVTLGAPFWFDTLNQFMVVRSTIKPREKSDVEGSKDSKKKAL